MENVPIGKSSLSLIEHPSVTNLTDEELEIKESFTDKEIDDGIHSHKNISDAGLTSNDTEKSYQLYV